MIQDFSKQISEINSAIAELKQSEDVQNYLSLMNQYEMLEKELKEIVKQEECEFEYFDMQKDSMVKISPTIRSSYKVDVDEVVLRWGDKYLTQTPNIKMMEQSPECSSYLKEVEERKVVPTKRAIKS